MRLLFYAFVLCMTPLAMTAQNSLVGIWQGRVDVGNNIRLVFHIEDDGKGGLSGTMDSPDQGVTALQASEVKVYGDSLRIFFEKYVAGFSGKVVGQDTIKGAWVQGHHFPLDLYRTNNPVRLNRPQTPEPPFPYLSEDVIYKSKDGAIQYGATLTIPQGKGPFPAVMLITGSGPQNRDEELFGHKPFAVIADYLTKRGYLVLRADDRGIGKTTGDFASSTSADFAFDVNQGLDYLRTRREVDKDKMGLLGHSEGGMIAPVVAGQRKDIDFLVLMAAPGVKVAELMEAQNVALMEQKGAGKELVKAYADLYRRFTKAVIQTRDTQSLRTAMLAGLKEWRNKTQDSLVAQATGIPAEVSEEGFVDLFFKEFSTPWMRYFISFDPQPYLKKLNARVLALNGSKDVQVLAGQNLDGIRSCLEKSNTKIYNVKKIEGVNHLFQPCKLCTVQEYAQIEETIAPGVLQTIGDWLDQQLK